MSDKKEDILSLNKLKHYLLPVKLIFLENISFLGLTKTRKDPKHLNKFFNSSKIRELVENALKVKMKSDQASINNETKKAVNFFSNQEGIREAMPPCSNSAQLIIQGHDDINDILKNFTDEPGTLWHFQHKPIKKPRKLQEILDAAYEDVRKTTTTTVQPPLENYDMETTEFQYQNEHESSSSSSDNAMSESMLTDPLNTIPDNMIVEALSETWLRDYEEEERKKESQKSLHHQEAFNEDNVVEEFYQQKGHQPDQDMEQQRHEAFYEFEMAGMHEENLSTIQTGLLMENLNKNEAENSNEDDAIKTWEMKFQKHANYSEYKIKGEKKKVKFIVLGQNKIHCAGIYVLNDLFKNIPQEQNLLIATLYCENGDEIVTIVDVLSPLRVVSDKAVKVFEQKVTKPLNTLVPFVATDRDVSNCSNTLFKVFTSPHHLIDSMLAAFRADHKVVVMNTTICFKAVEQSANQMFASEHEGRKAFMLLWKKIKSFTIKPDKTNHSLLQTISNDVLDNLDNLIGNKPSNDSRILLAWTLWLRMMLRLEVIYDGNMSETLRVELIDQLRFWRTVIIPVNPNHTESLSNGIAAVIALFNVTKVAFKTKTFTTIPLYKIDGYLKSESNNNKPSAQVALNMLQDMKDKGVDFVAAASKYDYGFQKIFPTPELFKDIYFEDYFVLSNLSVSNESVRKAEAFALLKPLRFKKITDIEFAIEIICYLKKFKDKVLKVNQCTAEISQIVEYLLRKGLMDH